MKSSTYAGVVMIVFLQHKKSISKSIDGVIRSTDLLCETLGLQDTLSHMTKYRIISDMIQNQILISRKTNKSIKLRFSQKVLDML